MSEPSKTDRRRLRPSPAWLVVGSLVVTAALFLSERYRWFAFNQHKGWTVLIAVAAVLAVLAAMLLWWLAAAVFRWRFQFSIRSLLVLVLAVALPCSWLAVEMRKAREQRKAVEALVEMRKKVYYDLELRDSFDPFGTSPSIPQPLGVAWLRSIVGDEFFANAVEILADDTRVTDAELENLRGLSTLQVLLLDDTRVTDSGLKSLLGLRALEYLSLNCTQVTDAGLESLRGLTALRRLRLTCTRVSDVGLESLRGLTALQLLCLDGTQVTDAGLESLQGLTALQELDLSGTQVTDAGVEKLQQALPNCSIDH